MWKRINGVVVPILGVGMVIYHLAYSQYLIQGPSQNRITHLGLGLLLIFASSLGKGGKYWPLKLAAVLASLGCFIYVFICYPRLELYGMLNATAVDLIVGIIIIILCLEATRHTFGWVLPILAILAIGYIFLGCYLPPGLFHSMHMDWDIIIETLTIGFGDTGIFGFLLGVSATFIFLFMVFASLVQVSGATEFFVQIGNLIGRKARSSAAMAAIVTSGLVGSISGQAGPNVMITGSYTIPTMKKAGYTPEQAGGIEAAASTAGPIIPPVMGVAAFLMSGITGIPYAKIVGVAILPALLYVWGGALYVEFQARKMNLASSQVEVDYRALFLTAPLFLGSLGIIIALFMMGRSPMYVGFWACLGIIIMSLIRKKTRPSFSSLVKGLVSGALTGASVAATVGTLGIIVAVLTNTGLGVKLAAVIGTVAGDNLLLLLILTGVGALVLGIGLPASAAYLVVAIVLAPILVKGGVPLLAAHLFAFYLANFSYITPPVAVAAVFASRVAGSDFIKTAFQASKVGIGAYVMPFMVVWVGALTWRFSDPFFTVTGIISCIITFIGIQASLAGYFLTDLNLIERFTFMAGSLLLLAHIATTNIGWFIAGIAILVVMVFWQKHKNDRLRQYPLGESQNN